MVCLDEDIPLQGSWTVKSLIGVPSGIMTEQAAVLANSTSQESTGDFPEVKICSTIPSNFVQEQLKVESAVIGTSNELYYLLTLVSTSKSLRCIDPASIYLGRMHAIQPKCSHQPSSREVHPWTMTSILQSWGPSGPKFPTQTHAHIVFAGSSILNRNFALALAGEGCVLQTDTCCFGCLADNAFGCKKPAIAFEGRTSEKRLFLNI